MKDELSRTIFRVFSTRSALEELRAKEVARTLEILELELDLSVLRMHALAKELDGPSEREQVVSALREVRAYRQAHPRRTESDLSKVAHGVLARSIQVSKERIQEILDEVA
jgi:hypothetical protein